MRDILLRVIYALGILSVIAGIFYFTLNIANSLLID